MEHGFLREFCAGGVFRSIVPHPLPPVPAAYNPYCLSVYVGRIGALVWLAHPVLLPHCPLCLTLSPRATHIIQQIQSAVGLRSKVDPSLVPLPKGTG